MFVLTMFVLNDDEDDDDDDCDLPQYVTIQLDEFDLKFFKI